MVDWESLGLVERGLRRVEEWRDERVAIFFYFLGFFGGGEECVSV